MKRTIYALTLSTAVLLAASPVLADTVFGNQSNAYGGQGGAGGNAAQSQGQAQGQHQGQGQSQSVNNANFNANSNKNYNTAVSGSHSSSGAAAFNKGNSLSTSNTTNVDASTEVNAEPAIAPNVSLTSSSCIGSVSGSGAGGGIVSIGLGGTFQYDDCLKNEIAKTYISMGMRDKAAAVLESIDFIRDVVKAEKPVAAATSSNVAVGGPGGALTAEGALTGAMALAPAKKEPTDQGCRISRALAEAMGASC